MVPTISIVDDDESVRKATENLVRSLGYAAATFSSAGGLFAVGYHWAIVLPDYRSANATNERS